MTLVSITARDGRQLPVRVRRPAERRSASRSATRGLDVLECFGVEQRPLRAVEIGKRLALAASSVNQLLKTMVESGHLVFYRDTKSYYPSPRLVGSSAFICRAYGDDDWMRSLVHDLAASSGMSITLSTPNDLFMQIIFEEIDGERVAERGLRVALFGSAIGSAYLATLHEEDLDRLARRSNIQPGLLSGIVAAVSEIEALGFAEGAGPVDNVWTIAIPLPPAAAPIPLVLGLAGPRPAVEPCSLAFRSLMFDAIRRRLPTYSHGAAET